MREDGYANIDDYAILSDGRVNALVARDGAIDWMSAPTMGESTLFNALLDAERGGGWTLAPADTFTTERRYLPRTNVLETTFTTDQGTLRVTDSLNMQDGAPLPWIELARRIHCTRGTVTVRWRVEPRFDFGRTQYSIARRAGALVAHGGRLYLAIRAWDAGDADCDDKSIYGQHTFQQDEHGLLTGLVLDDEPIPFPSRDEVEARIDATARDWRRWLSSSNDEGRWKRPVERSALVLKALTYAPSGAITAAATTSLPERLGGDRNFDYRFSWVRDSAFAMDALTRLGLRNQVHRNLSWLLTATRRTHPRLWPIYDLDGGVAAAESHALPLRGWRGTQPVREGNGAADQLQLGTYGDVMETIRLYCRQGNALDEETANRVVEICNLVCDLWRQEDAGIWELTTHHHYTTSKVQAWGAIDRALGLVEMGQIEPTRADVRRWQQEQEAIREFVEGHSWSDSLGYYASYADGRKLDASILLNARIGFVDPAGERMQSTIDAVREHLSAGGPLLYRYTDVRGKEGAFVACSFWLVLALVRAGRAREARQQMDAMLELANDVGLYSEEIDPHTLTFRGNMPQALSHLALINAAHIFRQVQKQGPFPARAATRLSR